MHALILRRTGCPHCDRAEAFLRSRFDDVTIVRSSGPGVELSPSLLDGEVDVLLAFRSHIIVRKPFLEAIPLCINFHPGPPERPGTGCVNFAIAEGDETYGSTCHHMAAQIDAGAIVDVRRFPITEADDVSSILGRTYDYMLCQFYDIVSAIAAGRELDSGEKTWAGKATYKRQMDALRSITLAPEARVALERQIRATSYGPYQPFIELHGRRFTLDTSPASTREIA